MIRADRKIDISTLSQGNRSISGVFLGAEIGQSCVCDIIHKHIAAVATGEMGVVIDRRFSLAEAAQSHAYIESRQAFGRVLLIPQAPSGVARRLGRSARRSRETNALALPYPVSRWAHRLSGGLASASQQDRRTV